MDTKEYKEATATRAFQEYAPKYCEAVEAAAEAKDKMDLACEEDHKASYASSPYDTDMKLILAEAATQACFAYEDAKEATDAVMDAFLDTL
jgi:hypothetical protein